MATDPPALQIARIANQHGLPPELVRAIVQVESDGNPWATRYEPGFFDRYIKAAAIRPIPPCSLLTERQLRAMSFGLMQIMGETARWIGFDGPFLTALCDPEIGLEYGCRYLSRLVKTYLDKDGWNAVIAAYNAGSPRKDRSGAFVNQKYVDKVMALWKSNV